MVRPLSASVIGWGPAVERSRMLSRFRARAARPFGSKYVPSIRGPRCPCRAIMAASCSGFHPRPTIPEIPHMSAAILSVARDAGLFVMRLQKGHNFIGEEFFGLLHRFQGAASDVRSDEQIRVSSRVGNQRMVFHAG